MKLLSALPALLAKISELVDRNVTSDITVLQEADFPLLPFPFPYRIKPTFGTTLQGESTSASQAWTVANAAQQNQLLMTLSRGVYRLSFNVQYTSNYASTGMASGIYFSLTNPTLVTAPIFQLTPANTVLVAHSEIFVTVEVNTPLYYSLAGNALGQSHTAILTANAQKYL